MLPNFVVIGGSRCGSTFLRTNLHMHPDIFVLPPREVYASGDAHFFDVSNEEGRANYARGVDWYERLFDDAKGARAVGEKTGSYLADPETPALIARNLGPETKLIALLRDPVDRAYSSYWYHRLRYFPDVSFRNALATADGRALLLEPGFYGQHLARYLQYFERTGIYVTLSEQVFSDPAAHLKAMCKFLEVDPERLPSPSREPVNRSVTRGPGYAFEVVGHRIKRRWPEMFDRLKALPGSGLAKSVVARSRGNSRKDGGGGGRGASYAPMPERDRAELREIYRDDVAALANLIDADPRSCWSS